MSYSTIIQESIAYIETHLPEELSLESMAKFAGFSKYHYHRIFQQEVGVSVSEYIRFRRIANSSNMLLLTDERIIDIAIYYHFESQESFTRSFKKYYQLPPGQYRKIMGKLTMQREEMKMKNEQLLKGWQLSGSHPSTIRWGLTGKPSIKGERPDF